MQNNSIEYLRKSIKKLSRFNYFLMIINLIISCLLILTTILAFMEVIEFEIYYIIFLFLFSSWFKNASSSLLVKTLFLLKSTISSYIPFQTSISYFSSK